VARGMCGYRDPGAARGPRGRAAGFTLTEVVIVAVGIALLAAIVIVSLLNAIERARLARCMAEVRGIQAAIIMDSHNGRRFMDPATFWATHYNGRKPGPYYYLLDGDPNKGHGNDLDGIDEENPGESWRNRDRKDILCDARGLF
jgi:type II secretory pathway pseudopilin PulG